MTDSPATPATASIIVALIMPSPRRAIDRASFLAIDTTSVEQRV